MSRVEIVNGAGDGGYSVKVDSDKRLHTLAVSEAYDLQRNLNGYVFSIPVSVTPTGVNDEFFYLKNNGTTDLRITDIRIAVATADRFIVKWVTGTASGGTAVTPVSRNGAFSRTVDATIEEGADITGLTDDGVLFYVEAETANKLYHIRTSSNIIVSPGTAIAIEAVTGTAAVRATISVVDQFGAADET